MQQVYAVNLRKDKNQPHKLPTTVQELFKNQAASARKPLKNAAREHPLMARTAGSTLESDSGQITERLAQYAQSLRLKKRRQYIQAKRDKKKGIQFEEEKVSTEEADRQKSIHDKAETIAELIQKNIADKQLEVAKLEDTIKSMD